MDVMMSKTHKRIIILLAVWLVFYMIVSSYIKHNTGGSLKEIKESIKVHLRRLNFFEKLIGELELNPLEVILKEAKQVSLFNRTVLVTLMNDAFIPFAFSWLCNTQAMDIHQSVLVVTTNDGAMEKLKTVWPNIHVVSMNVDIAPGKQDYSTVEYVRIMIRRAELFLTLIEAGYEVMLFEFDYVWFDNPVPKLQTMNDVDMLVNPISTTNNKRVNGGFIYLFPTTRTKTLWRELTHRLHDLDTQIRNKSAGDPVSEGTNDQTFLSALVLSRYANITTRQLPLDKYADGKWYSSSTQQRQQWRPMLISNNWIIGVDNKIKRAKQFGHWFLKDDGTCDLQQVNRMTKNIA